MILRRYFNAVQRQMEMNTIMTLSQAREASQMAVSAQASGADIGVDLWTVGYHQLVAPLATGDSL